MRVKLRVCTHRASSIKRQLWSFDTWVDAWEWVWDWFLSIAMYSNTSDNPSINPTAVARCVHTLKKMRTHSGRFHFRVIENLLNTFREWTIDVFQDGAKHIVLWQVIRVTNRRLNRLASLKINTLTCKQNSKNTSENNYIKCKVKSKVLHFHIWA